MYLVNRGDDILELWERVESFVAASASSDASSSRPELHPPYFAVPWAGGQGVARYVLDNPECVAGKRVLDVGSGCGVAALAAAAAGAAEVTANDVDPLASVAFRANARLCGLSGASSFHTEWSPYDRVRVVNAVS
jgi:predicted nicotinamide N-methyase